MTTITVAGTQIARCAFRVLNYGAALSLLGMTALTCADVFGRYFFNAPVFGALELTELLLAAVIFFGLPMATSRAEHITVDLFDACISQRMLNIQGIVSNLVCALFSAFIAWQLWDRAQGMLLSGEQTGQLGIKLGWLAILMMITMVLTCGAFLVAPKVRGIEADTLDNGGQP
ncbi:MAG: TRAP transporter small permease [Burkholderiaceae bacterium]|nr:TRAP transporter small permease [Burkholderiaceae bacterium]